MIFHDFSMILYPNCINLPFLPFLPIQGSSIESLVSELKSSEDVDVHRSTARALYDLCVGKDATALRHKQQAAEARLAIWEVEVLRCFKLHIWL